MTALRRTSAAALALLVALVLARVSGGCLDITPDVVPPRDASGITQGEPCRHCIEAQCGPDLGTCVSDPHCTAVYECMTVEQCLDHPDFNEKIVCTLPCLTDAGITSAQDPAVDILVKVVQCGEVHCSTECNIDGGIDLDGF